MRPSGSKRAGLERTIGILVYLPECCLIDRLQHDVLRSIAPLLQAFHSGLQRVGCHAGFHLCRLQLRLEQLSVRLLPLCLFHYLAQGLQLGLWQVFLLGIGRLLP